MRILVSYRGIPQSPGWATGDMVVKAFRALGHEVDVHAKYYEQEKWVECNPIKPAYERDYDLFLFMECNDGDRQYIELRSVRARQTACWLFDTSYHKDRYTRLVDYFKFNHIFLANPLTIQEYKKWEYQNVHYLPYACDRELHGRSLSYPKTRDVVLVGSIRDDRIVLADALDQLGVKLELIGNVYREKYIDALASARIVINQNPPAGRGLLNMRWFETAAAGSIILGEREDLSVNNIWCFGDAHAYSSINGLAEICKAYLENQGTQDWVRSITYENIFKLHTYENRCKEILNKIFPNERN
jgi:spore maturation protein CgeB